LENFWNNKNSLGEKHGKNEKIFFPKKKFKKFSQINFMKNPRQKFFSQFFFSSQKIFSRFLLKEGLHSKG